MIAIAIGVVVVSGAGPALAQPGDANAGKAVYARKCALCHGDKGDGKGPAAELLEPRPRDFTTGIYKIRTTANKVPTDQDLFRIISEGMPGTSMPPWSVLPGRDRWNLVAYIKTFAGDKLEEGPKKLELPPEVASSEASLKRGKEMFEAIECNKCHGAAGRADGPSRAELKDDWGHPIPPANLAKPWNFRGGVGRADIAMRIAAGVLGTPMPSFIDSVEKPEDIWHLTNYVLSLAPAPQIPYATLIRVTAVSEPVSDDPDGLVWNRVAPQYVPLMGQVILDPRNFNPAIDLVAVRAVYNDREIAFHLTWDDPTQSVADPAKKVFADAVAVQLPLEVTAGPERPYFLMGEGSDPVYALRWEGGKGVAEVTANGPTKLTPVAAPAATGKAVYQDGQYRLVVKRPLGGADGARPALRPGVFVPVAFQAWDGGAGETGARMSLTSWYYLRLEEPESNRRFLLPPVVAILTLAVMVVVVRAANRWM